MTESELGQYKALRNELKDLNCRIEEARHAETVTFGTVKGSRVYFPYTQKTYHVAGADPAEEAQRQEKLSELLMQREAQMDELVQKQREIENYINEIPDSITRVIFRMYFFDGLNQLEIGRKTGYDQGTVSRKIRSYIKSHNMHTISC